ncbi:MAG: Nif3-like dinuclear metal center hexameric protein [Faecousia sp.]
MATVADILQYIETLAPRSMKESWDNVGLNCGHLDRTVTKILVALDPFAHVCREAKDFGAQLLVTHHVLIFQPGFLTDADQQGRNALFLIENGIAHINAHTNLDCAPGGVNDCLAAKLGLSGIRVIHPSGVDEAGREWGLLRCGDTEEQSLTAFLTFVKENLGCEGLRYVDGGKPVRKVAVGGGSCGSEMLEALEAGCDTFVTSDIKYNQFWDAKDLGLNLIDAGHFYTENPVVSYLAEKLLTQFPEVEVKISETHRDCMKFF